MTLYLTSAERSLYNALPANLTKLWGGEVVEETGTAWETEDELRTRAERISAKVSPEHKAAWDVFAKKVSKGGMAAVTEADFPEELLPSAILVLGAVGLLQVMNQVLQSAKRADDLNALADLSGARHQILTTNPLVLSF